MPTKGAVHASRPDAVKVLVVDDHPALRAGLEGLLGHVDGLLFLGAVRDEQEAHAALAECRPDVVVLDHALARGDGLSACFRIKQLPGSPRVVMYSAYVDGVFVVPATLAQADGMVSKSAPVDELLAAIRAVAVGERRMPTLDREAMRAASSRLEATDLPIVGMLLARVRIDEIADALGVHSDEICSRALRLIGALQSRTPRDDARREQTDLVPAGSPAHSGQRR
jgi:DNA-binding NarL/FixJ family response regulator